MSLVIGRVFRRIIRGLVLRPVLGMSLLVLIVGGIAGAGFLALTPNLPKPEIAGVRFPFGGNSPGRADVTHDAPQSTENYLRGNQSFNADLMWNALGTEAQERFRMRGATTQDLQRQMDLAREQGTALEDFSYIGGQQLPDGTSMHFYLVLTRGPQSRSDPNYIPYVFTLDRGGKIARVQ